MSEELQHLMERIKTEAIDEAEARAREIVTEAEQQAADLVRKAQEEANRHREARLKDWATSQNGPPNRKRRVSRRAVCAPSNRLHAIY